MQKFSTWMVLALDVMFWILRIIATYTNSMGIEFMIKPMDMNMEIAMIFCSLNMFCIHCKEKIFRFYCIYDRIFRIFWRIFV